MTDGSELDQETIAQAEALAAKLWAAVEQTSAYRQWAAAQRLVRAIKGEQEESASSFASVLWNFQNAKRHADIELSRYPKHRTVVQVKRRVSQADAAEKALIKARKPLTTSEMIDAIKSEGAHVGGAEPLINVSSTLSKDPRFKSLRWGGGSVWWFSNTPLPDGPEFQAMLEQGGALDFGGQTGAQTPAAEGS